MTTELEYALMAGAAYFSTRAPINRFPIPAGWSQLDTLDNNSGFEVVAFQHCMFKTEQLNADAEYMNEFGES